MQNNIRLLLNGFKRIKPIDAELFRQYYSQMEYPRYFCSNAVLSTNPFYFKVQDGVLLVLKRQWISGYPIVYLSQPPLSLPNTVSGYKLEREIVDAFAASNIPTRMTILDGVRLDMGYRKLIAKGKDYIYRLDDADASKKQCYIRRICDKLLLSGRLYVDQQTHGELSHSLMRGALSVINRWHTMRRESPMRTIMKLKRFTEIAAHSNMLLTVSYLDDVAVDCTLSELYTPNLGVYVFGYYDASATFSIKDWARYEYIVDNDHWKTHNPDSLFASGGIRNNSRKLAYAKNKINPITVDTLYQQADVNRFSKDDYHQFSEDRNGNLVFKENKDKQNG